MIPLSKSRGRLRSGVIGGMIALMALTAIPAPRAEAATIAELQAQIQTLLAQLQALSGGSTATSCLFTSDLTVGRSGSEVTALQQFLMGRGHSIPAGATGYFGEQTRVALAQFQVAQGITPAVGYFGPVTRARVNALCTPTTPTTPSTPSTPSTPNLSGEGWFGKFDAQSGDDTNLEEGQKNARVMEIEFDAEDGDIRVNRIDLAFTPDSANDEDDPWDTFSEVSIYNGGDRIARVDAGNRRNWTEDEPENGSYRLRMNGVNFVAEEDETVTLSVRITVANSVDGANDGENWSIFVPTNGIRGFDADRASIYTGDSADSISLNIDEEGQSDELIVKRSDADPDAMTLALESNDRSDWLTVFAFDLDTDDSSNDIEIRRLPVQFTVDASTVGTFMRDARIVVDGKTYTKYSVTNGATNTITFEFDRGELVIDGGDRVTARVEMRFNALAAMYEGTTIRGTVDVDSIDAEGADDLSGSQLAGGARSEVHTLRTKGANVGSGNTTATYRANANNDLTDDEGSYSVKFEVTAFNDDIYIHRSATRGTALGTGGVNFVIENASNGSVVTGDGDARSALSSDARMEGDFYVVREGETRSFTLMVTYNPETSAFYQLQAYSINWNTTAAAPTAQQRLLPESNYETPALSI